MDNELITGPIENRIFTIRGQKVMLDRDLAELYGVEVKRLNEAVRRNIERFPFDFMFQLNQDEWENLRSQIATFNKDVRKYKPYAFTEHGILMLSNVLNSISAINVSIKIIEAFVRMRQYVVEQYSKDTRIEELSKLLMLHIENNDKKHTEYDEAINQIIQALNNLIEQPKETKKVGFNTDK